MGTLYYFYNFPKSLKLFQNLKLKKSLRDSPPTGSHNLCFNKGLVLLCCQPPATLCIPEGVLYIHPTCEASVWPGLCPWGQRALRVVSPLPSTWGIIWPSLPTPPTLSSGVLLPGSWDLGPPRCWTGRCRWSTGCCHFRRRTGCPGGPAGRHDRWGAPSKAAEHLRETREETQEVRAAASVVEIQNWEDMGLGRRSPRALRKWEHPWRQIFPSLQSVLWGFPPAQLLAPENSISDWWSLDPDSWLERASWAAVLWGYLSWGLTLTFLFPASGVLSSNAKQHPRTWHVRGNSCQKANAQYLEDTILGKVASYSHVEFCTTKPFKMRLGDFRGSPYHPHGHLDAVVEVMLFLDLR